jgi:protein gp37
MVDLTIRPDDPTSRRPVVSWPLPNVWLGVSVEDQQWADIRIPALLATPAAVRWISAEPLLGPVDLVQSINQDPLAAYHFRPGGLDWVVVGGESGPGARPMHPDWARRLRDQCAAAGVPFLFKQWGAWVDEETGRNTIGEDSPVYRRTRGNNSVNGDRMQVLDQQLMVRVGKKAAGRELDGVTHDGYPAGATA